MVNSAVYLTTLVAIVMIAGSEGILCRKNEIWAECSNSCAATCTNPNPDDKCIQVCKQPSCVCRTGFVWNGTDCVRPQDCNNLCPKNQVWSACPSYCPETCGKPLFGACILACKKPGCVCRTGFVRNGTDCVRREDCNNLCPKNQVWSACPSHCPETCGNPLPGACILGCKKPGCVCRTGFVWNGTDCVRREDCKNLCPKNQVWSLCPSSCPKTCEKPRTDACIQVCRKPGCVCKKDYVLNKQGMCVRVEDCKK